MGGQSKTNIFFLRAKEKKMLTEKLHILGRFIYGAQITNICDVMSIANNVFLCIFRALEKIKNKLIFSNLTFVNYRIITFTDLSKNTHGICILFNSIFSLNKYQLEYLRKTEFGSCRCQDEIISLKLCVYYIQTKQWYCTTINTKRRNEAIQIRFTKIQNFQFAMNPKSILCFSKHTQQS